jgi:hypothetical protein
MKGIELITAAESARLQRLWRPDADQRDLSTMRPALQRV